MNIFKKVFKSVLGSAAGITSLNWILPGKWGKKKQLEQFNGYIHSIVSKFAMDFARVDLNLKKKLGNKWQEIEEHELLSLLKAPNKAQTGFQFLELHGIYMKLAGESFWYVVSSELKKPKELYLLRPDLVDVKISSDNIGSVAGYELQLEGGKKQTFTPEEIIHHKLPNPINPYRGLGIIEAAMVYIQTESYASDWTKNSIYNSGRPSGILNLRGSLSDEQYQQLKKRFNQEYSGTKNAGKTLLVKGFDGVDWVKLGMDLEGIDLEKVKKLTREDLMFMFRVSNTMMGISDDVNRANSRELRGVWMENEIKPELDRLVNQIQYSLIDTYSKDLILSYKDPNPETIEDRLDDWTKGHNKWLTTNQIILERNGILGTETSPIEGGDFIWQPLSLTPMKTPKKETKQDNKPIEEALVIEEKHEEVKIKELSKYECGEIMRKSLFESQETWIEPFKEKVNEVFNEQEKTILENNEKSVAGWLFERVISIKLWKEILYPIVVEIMTQQAQYMFDFVDEEGISGILEITPQLQIRIHERIERFSRGVDEETLLQLQISIEEAMVLGENVSKIRERVRSIYENATTVRAERIARTETIFISNEASLEAMKQIPSVVAQEWMINPDACEFCTPLNGKIVGLNTNFFDLGETIEGSEGSLKLIDYEAVKHPPLHPNCRCCVLPVNITEYKDFRFTELEKLIMEYGTLDKRTKEARELQSKINNEQKTLI